MIENGKTVSVHYVGKFNDGEVFDSSEGKDPLEFQMGSGQLIPGFEAALIGKVVGDKVTTNIEAIDAYGEVREDLILTIDKDKMPDTVQVGQMLEARGEDGRVNHVVVMEINDDGVVIDANHPLAGKELTFDIEVVSIQ